MKEITSLFSHAFPKVQVHLDSNFASTSTGFRLRIREALHEIVNEERVLNLEKLPALKKEFVSISHCASLGGFVIAANGVGFDIEETQRVSSQVAERMKNAFDAAAPTPAAFWTAKEAAFKALGDKQPSIMSEIVIGNWQRVGDEQFKFTSDCGSGMVLVSGPWTAAIFLLV